MGQAIEELALRGQHPVETFRALREHAKACCWTRWA
jgi:hypothetical protein